MRVDFHLHTLASDGAPTPAELATAAADMRLRAWAITDHDTCAGWRAVRDAPGLVPGVECSTTWQGREIHVVGLGITPDEPDFSAFLTKNRALRLERMALMLGLLPQSVRGGLTVDGLVALAGNGPEGSVGRNHLARALARQGAVAGSGEAFTRWLSDEHLTDAGLPPYPDPTTTARAIRAAGGVAILAHPGCYGDLMVAIQLMELGLDGIEVAHPNLPGPLAQGLRTTAARRGWLQSCGTDLHYLGGTRRPGDCALGAERLQPLIERLQPAAA